jgi:hypothetical protein
MTWHAMVRELMSTRCHLFYLCVTAVNFLLEDIDHNFASGIHLDGDGLQNERSQDRVGAFELYWYLILL